MARCFMPGVKDWIVKAVSDLKSSRKLVKDDDDTLDTAAYHTQQSAEKAFKAYLIFKGVPILKTHDLEKLLMACMKHDSAFEQLRDNAEALSSYDTYARYPDDRFDIDREEVLEAIKHAETILKFVKNRVATAVQLPQLNLFE